MNEMRKWFTELKNNYEHLMALQTVMRNAQLAAPKPVKMQHEAGAEITLGKTTYTVQKDGSWRKNA